MHSANTAVAAERAKMRSKGYNLRHDLLEHEVGELGRVGVCYADFAISVAEGDSPDQPHPTLPEGWDWRPGDSYLESLVRAAAFIHAEIDRSLALANLSEDQIAQLINGSDSEE